MSLTWPEIGPPDERQGEYLRTQAYQWRCGNDECDCSQVMVERVYVNALAGRPWHWFVRIAESEFYTDGEDANHPEVAAELEAAKSLAAKDEAALRSSRPSGEG